MLDSEMVSGCRRCLKRKMVLIFQLMFMIISVYKTVKSLGNPYNLHRSRALYTDDIL